MEWDPTLTGLSLLSISNRTFWSGINDYSKLSVQITNIFYLLRVIIRCRSNPLMNEDK